MEWECKTGRSSAKVKENVNQSPLPENVKSQIDAKVCFRCDTEKVEEKLFTYIF